MAKKLHSFRLLYQSPVLSAVAFKFLISLPKWLEARIFYSISTEFSIVSLFDFKIYVPIWGKCGLHLTGNESLANWRSSQYPKEEVLLFVWVK